MVVNVRILIHGLTMCVFFAAIMILIPNLMAKEDVFAKLIILKIMIYVLYVMIFTQTLSVMIHRVVNVEIIIKEILNQDVKLVPKLILTLSLMD